MLGLPSEKKTAQEETRSWAQYKDSVQHSVLQCPSTTLLAVENSLSHLRWALFLSFPSRLLLWISQFVLTTDQLAGRVTLIRAFLAYSLKSFHYFVQLVTLPLSCCAEPPIKLVELLFFSSPLAVVNTLGLRQTELERRHSLLAVGLLKSFQYPAYRTVTPPIRILVRISSSKFGSWNH